MSNSEIVKKTKIRSLMRLIPKLVQASYVSQALETEKIVLATFNLSDNFKASMRNTPPNYIEKVAAIYRTIMFKCYEMGSKAAEAKPNAVKVVDSMDQMRIDVLAKLPLDTAQFNYLIDMFKLEVSELLKTKPNVGDVIAALTKDMSDSYVDGVIDFVISKQEEKDQKLPTLESKIETPADVVAATFGSEEIVVDKLVQYTKSFNDPVAEKVLRATLGLPITASAAVTAGAVPCWQVKKNGIVLKSLESEIEAEVYLQRLQQTMPDEESTWEICLCPDGGKEKTEVDLIEAAVQKIDEMMVGCFDVEVLRVSILEATKNSPVAGDDPQIVQIQTLVPNVHSYENEKAVVKAISERLCLSDVDFKVSSMAELDDALEELGEMLTDRIGLPGELLFVQVNSDFNLVFAYMTENAKELAVLNGSIVTAAKAKKQKSMSKSKELATGLLSEKHKKVIDDIHKVGKALKSMTMKELKKLSPELAAVVAECVAEMRAGKKTLSEMARLLSSSNESIIEKAFGADGLMYYQHVKAPVSTSKYGK